MKSFSALAATVMLLSFCSQGAVRLSAQAESSSSSPSLFSIAATPPSRPLQLGAPLVIAVTVKNISGHEIYWAYDRSDTTYKAFRVLLKKDGREVDTTAFHRKITGRQRPDDPQEVASSSTIALPLAADESFTWNLDLTKLYDIKSPGKYNLDICRPDTYSHTTVCARPMTLTITP